MDYQIIMESGYSIFIHHVDHIVEDLDKGIVFMDEKDSLLGRVYTDYVEAIIRKPMGKVAIKKIRLSPRI